MENAYRCGVHDGAGHKTPGVRHVSIACEQLDQVVTEAIVSAVLMAPSGAVPDADSEALKALHVRLSEVRQAEGNLLDLVESEEVLRREGGHEGTKLREQAARIESKMAEIAGRNARAALTFEAHAALWSGDKAGSFTDAAKVKQTIRERFAALTLEQRRALARAMVKVVVMPGRGPQRVQIEHLVAIGLNDEEEPETATGLNEELEPEPAYL